MFGDKVTIGGIIKNNHKDYCFKICFSNINDAQRFKDFIYWIAKDEKKMVLVNNGYFDDKEKYNYTLDGNEK